MSEQKLDQILHELSTFKQEVYQRFDLIYHVYLIDQRFDLIDQRFDRTESEIQEFREETRTEFQVLKAGQAGIRKEITDRFKEVKETQNRLQHSIDILNRRQLQIETEVEILKKK